MSIATEIARLQGAKSDLKTSIEGKGVTVPAATKIDGYAALVDQIQQGGGGHTGTVDTVGLTALGWDSYDIQWLQDHVWWDAEDDAEWAVTEANKAFGPNGATPLTWSNYTTAQRTNADIRYFPKLTLPNNITSLYNAFGGCYQLVAIPTHGWNVSAVTSFASCFWNCGNLHSVGDISYWVTSAATQIYGMFQNCLSMESIDVSHWNTSNITAMYSTFQSCASLKSLDLSSWSFSKVTNMSNLTNGCWNLESIVFPTSFSAPLVTALNSCFSQCALKEISLNLSAAALTNISNIFGINKFLKKAKFTIASTVLSNIQQLCYADYCCTEIDLTGIDTTGCAQSGVGTAAANSVTAECTAATTIKLGPNFFNGTFTTLYMNGNYSWTRDSIYESLYTNQTTRDSNSNAVTVKLATQAYDRLSAQDISDIATKNITLTRG